MKQFNFKPILSILIGLLLSFGSLSINAAGPKKKKVAKITFEKCCELNEGDTKKCRKMKKVSKKSKRMKKGKKWVYKTCAKPVAESAEKKTSNE